MKRKQNKCPVCGYVMKERYNNEKFLIHKFVVGNDCPLNGIDLTDDKWISLAIRIGKKKKHERK